MALTKRIKGIDRSIRQACYDAKARCNNPTHRLYSYYGGRGIEFKFNNPTELFEELGDKPDSRFSLDRIDNNGHYESGNVRWATKSEQMSNRRPFTKPSILGNTFNAKEYLITHPDGTKEKIFNMAEFCRKYGLDKANLQRTTNFKTRSHKGYRAEVI